MRRPAAVPVSSGAACVVAAHPALPAARAGLQVAGLALAAATGAAVLGAPSAALAASLVGLAALWTAARAR
jgi:hypothetical protein